MAEGKKSFVLYTDIIHVFKKLPKDKQADLIMMILEYVNDTNPVTEDILVDIAFDPIKRQLKRDLVKYESRAERSRENGSKGGRPSNLQEPKKPNGFINNLEEPKKPDTVIDIVNDIVNVTDINNTYTTETAFQIFDKSNLNGRFFSTMCHLNSLDESEVISEFKRWQIYHKGNDFKDEKAIRNSFSKWMSNYKPEKKTITKKFESKIDWDEIKKEMS